MTALAKRHGISKNEIWLRARQYMAELNRLAGKKGPTT